MTKQKMVYFCLSFSEQKLHANLDEFRARDELKMHRGAVTGSKKVLWMVYRDYAHSLSNSLQASNTTAKRRVNSVDRSSTWGKDDLRHSEAWPGTVVKLAESSNAIMNADLIIRL